MSTIQTTTKYNNTTDFPVLGTEMPQKKSNYNASKGNKLSIDQLGFNSHIDDLRNERRSYGGRHRHDDGRTKAYEQLQDKEAMAERLTKTRLCWSVQKGVVCPHGDGKCKFAHTHEELSLAPCLFGMRCRFVRWSDETGEYTNTGSKTCGYQHPEETRANCMCRTGLDQIVLKVAKKRSKVMKTPTKLVPSQVTTNAPRKSAWSRPYKITPTKYDADDDEREVVKDEEDELLDLLEKTIDDIDDIEEDDEELLELLEKTIDEVVKDADHELLEKTIVDIEEEYKDEVVNCQIDDSDSEWEDEDDIEATFSVPKDLAVDALIAAMEEGKKRITICIV